MHDEQYRLWLPIDDNDSLLKSVDVDENGDYIVQGVMTSDSRDEEDDRISPEGMDCSYFLTKGWIKYEHGNRPDQFIGEPLDIRVGQFTHPKLQKSVNGIFVKARLFAQRALAKQAVETIQDLQKSSTKRCMGWSIEGQVQERDRKSGKILKSILRNVVLTMNPVNTTTWAELSKSFAANHEIVVDCETPDFDKSMDTGSMAEVMPQSLEGSYTEDQQEKYLKLLRDIVEKHYMNKSLRNQFLANSQEEIQENAFNYAVYADLDVEEAQTFSTYIAEKSPLLKSIFTRFGGDKMESVASFLDQELEELEKSLNDIDDEDNELVKAVSSDDDEDEESTDNEDNNDNNDKDEEDDDDDDGDTEKSFKSDLTKSLSEDHGQAFEVSDFLTSLTDELGISMEGLEKSMMQVVKTNNVLTKSIKSILQTNQELAQKIESLESDNDELRKSLGDILQRPVGRKSVVSARDRQTISKSAEIENLTPAKVQDILMKAFETKEIQGSEIIRFESGVGLQDLNLPETVKSRLGI